jgi:ABC-type lipoprotein export system ATPase subunit
MYPRKSREEKAEERMEKKMRINHDLDLSYEIEGRKVLLETVDVIKQYRQYDQVVTAVNRASFRVFQNEFVAIVGTSGSGKSTLLHLCAGLDRPNAGEIYVRGNKLGEMTPDQLGRFRGTYIGMVFQTHHLIPHFTALENILVPTMMCYKSEDSYSETLKKLVATLDIGDRLHHLPSELSGGQQQRVAIARALINRPQIIFADEPTGNLDRENADDVLSLLLETKELLGQSLVMVTHDLTIAAKADRVYKMDAGKLRPWKRSLDGELPGYIDKE